MTAAAVNTASVYCHFSHTTHCSSTSAVIRPPDIVSHTHTHARILMLLNHVCTTPGRHYSAHVQGLFNICNICISIFWLHAVAGGRQNQQHIVLLSVTDNQLGHSLQRVHKQCPWESDSEIMQRLLCICQSRSTNELDEHQGSDWCTYWAWDQQSPQRAWRLPASQDRWDDPCHPALSQPHHALSLN